MTHHKDREYEAEAIIIVNALAEEKDPVRFVGKVLTEAHKQGRELGINLVYEVLREQYDRTVNIRAFSSYLDEKLATLNR